MTASERFEFPVEIIDEAEGEVLIFDDAEMFAMFEEAEASSDPTFDYDQIRRRALTLRDHLSSMVGELDILLAAA
ncbi:hypothetical protein [Leucobacter sp. cx-169]|uniref:hypothetical protein n=1 Tax=Leucobacter sp. cx-169 TaxID=2770549 RepID=UPI00165E5311|nr:hypothetical protein [Leucobacter sp. cx-169]MBC9927310.1 hypothetical protein [Leucobacter sp. cx-169]